MRRTAAQVSEHLAAKPVLLLFGQFDPVRLVGGVSRFQKMFRNSTVAVIPRERHFPILAAGEEVAAALATWMQAIGAHQPAATSPTSAIGCIAV